MPLRRNLSFMTSAVPSFVFYQQTAIDNDFVEFESLAHVTPGCDQGVLDGGARVNDAVFTEDYVGPDSAFASDPAVRSDVNRRKDLSGRMNHYIAREPNSAIIFHSVDH